MADTTAPASDDGLLTGDDGVTRCAWCGTDTLYREYHDLEWGRPSADDRALFEKLCLEGFQAGLSWITILRKRQAFRHAFAEFQMATVAGFGPAEVERLLGDAGIVRHRGKIEAVIVNAARALELQREAGSLAAFLWRFAPPARPGPLDWATLRTTTESESTRALSKELRKRGWRFVGPTTLYAFMQAMGFVNDHARGCAFYEPCAAERRSFLPPG